MADPIREALERLVVQLAATYDPDGPVPAWADSYFGAIAVLAAEPPAPVPSLPLQTSSLPFALSPISGWGAYVNGNLAAVYSDRDGAPGHLRWSTSGEVHPDIVKPSAPAPADHVPDAGNMVAADDEREELAQWLDHKGRGAWPCPDGFSAEAEAEEYEMFSGLTRAAALLRQPAPAPAPMPVSERPWERPGWCDAEGRCWFGAPCTNGGCECWTLVRPLTRLSCEPASLPHWAIPQPPQGGEVERWPETYSRRQRAEEAERLCTEAGIDLKSPDAQRLVRDARDGMPLHDVLDLIKHWNATITTESPDR